MGEKSSGFPQPPEQKALQHDFMQSTDHLRLPLFVPSCLPLLHQASNKTATPNISSTSLHDYGDATLKMVLLTMTPVVLEALDILQSVGKSEDEPVAPSESNPAKCQDDEEELENQADGQNEGTTDTNAKGPDTRNVAGGKKVEEPSLSNPKLGNPISHGQIIDIWNQLKLRTSTPKRLDTLLQGSSVYIAPPKPMAEPVSPE